MAGPALIIWAVRRVPPAVRARIAAWVHANGPGLLGVAAFFLWLWSLDLIASEARGAGALASLVALGFAFAAGLAQGSRDRN